MSGPSIPHARPRLNVTVARDLETLEPFAEQWNALASAAPQQLPMLSHAWVSAFLEHRVPAGQTWFCVLVRDAEGSLVGVLPLLADSKGRSFCECTVLRTPHDDHTLSGDLLVAQGRGGEVLPALLGGAFAACRGPRYIEFARIPETSGTLAELRDASVALPVTKEFRGIGAFLRVEGSFQDYRADLSRNFRSNLNKAARKLERLPDVQIEFLRGAQATEQQLPRFTKVEDASWKGRAGSAIARSPELIAFYETLTRNLSAAGWLQWHFVHANGQTIAGNLAIKCDRSVVVWKLGYDETYAKCSPGSLLFQALVEAVASTGECSQIDLMTDMPWYDNWRMEKRPYYDLRVYPRRPAALLCFFAPKVLRLLLRTVPGVLPAVHFVRRLLGRVADP